MSCLTYGERLQTPNSTPAKGKSAGTGQVTCMVAAGGLSGGVTASMAGGSFWEGVCNGLICAGLNHAMHVTIFYGKGLMIASITGQKRHIIGPDAIAGAITLDASGGVAMSAEGGGILVLVGDEKGFYSYSDLGIGGGLVTVSVGVELVELYSSSPDSEVSLSDFIGSRWELNASLAAYSVNVGITALYGKHSVNDSNGRTGFTIGFGGNVGLDAIPFRFNGNINYGATQVGSNSRLKDELKKAFNITRK